MFEDFTARWKWNSKMGKKSFSLFIWKLISCLRNDQYQFIPNDNDFQIINAHLRKACNN